MGFLRGMHVELIPVAPEFSGSIVRDRYRSRNLSGFRGFRIGENFMKAIKALIGHLHFDETLNEP